MGLEHVSSMGTKTNSEKCAWHSEFPWFFISKKWAEHPEWGYHILFHAGCTAPIGIIRSGCVLWILISDCRFRPPGGKLPCKLQWEIWEPQTRKREAGIIEGWQCFSFTETMRWPHARMLLQTAKVTANQSNDLFIVGQKCRSHCPCPSKHFIITEKTQKQKHFMFFIVCSLQPIHWSRMFILYQGFPGRWQVKALLKSTCDSAQGWGYSDHMQTAWQLGTPSGHHGIPWHTMAILSRSHNWGPNWRRNCNRAEA